MNLSDILDSQLESHNRDVFIGERNDTLDAGEIQFGEHTALSCCVFERNCTIPAADEALGG